MNTYTELRTALIPVVNRWLFSEYDGVEAEVSRILDGYDLATMEADGSAGTALLGVLEALHGVDLDGLSEDVINRLSAAQVFTCVAIARTSDTEGNGPW